MFRWRSWLGIVLMLTVISIAGRAQQSKAEIASKADVLKFLDLMHAKSQMILAIQGMEKQMRLGAEQGFKSKVPEATPEQLAKVDELFVGTFKDLPIDEMMDAIVPIYQKHLTKADLAAATAFYSSPAGQKILKETPAITSEAMEAGGEIGRRLFEAKSAEFDKRLADLIAEFKKESSSSPK